MGKLSNGWGNFYSGEKNSLLSLEGDVLGPPDKSGEVSFGLNIVADSEISGSFFEEGISLLFDFLDSSFGFCSFTLS